MCFGGFVVVILLRFRQWLWWEVVELWRVGGTGEAGLVGWGHRLETLSALENTKGISNQRIFGVLFQKTHKNTNENIKECLWSLLFGVFLLESASSKKTWENMFKRSYFRHNKTPRKLYKNNIFPSQQTPVPPAVHWSSFPERSPLGDTRRAWCAAPRGTKSAEQTGQKTGV